MSMPQTPQAPGPQSGYAQPPVYHQPPGSPPGFGYGQPSAGPSGPPPVSPPPVKGHGVLVGVGILIVGTILSIALIVIGFIGVAGSLSPTPVNSTGAVTLTKPGNYAVYQIVPRDSVATVRAGQIKVTGPDGPVSISQEQHSLTVSAERGKDAAAVGTFKADKAGTYTISSDSQFVTVSGNKFAIGKPLSVKSAAVAGGGIMLGVFAWFVGIIIIIVSVIRRRHRRQNLYA